MSFTFETKNREKEANGGECAFEIQCGYPYRTVHLTVFPVANELTEEKLDYCLCHEALHAVLIPMQRNREAPWEYFQDNLELVTDHLSHVVMRNYRRRMDLEKQLKRRKA